MSSTELLDIPENLLQYATNRFDQLLSQGQIIWQPYEASNAEDKGFKVQFQTASHLRLKPINRVNSRSGAQDSSQNPFLNPDPLFVLPRPGQEHTLILNRYPVYRNSLLIHTNTFKSQADDLDETDLTACWKCLQVLTKKTISSGTDEKQWLMIYNCGLEAGTSQGHKHMQLWPVPSTSELGFDLFPGQVESTREITTVCDIPFKHFILRLPEGASVEDVIVAYNTILPEIKRCHEKYGSSAYNVVMTQQWLMLVPRCSSGSRWGLGGNTAVVLGLLWISEDEKRDLWEEYGISNHLARLGIPSINL